MFKVLTFYEDSSFILAMKMEEYLNSSGITKDEIISINYSVNDQGASALILYEED